MGINFVLAVENADPFVDIDKLIYYVISINEYNKPLDLKICIALRKSNYAVQIRFLLNPMKIDTHW